MLSEAGAPLELLVAVSNIGEADGFETVQVYVRDEKSRLPRPEKELVSFEKVFLERDQTRHLRIRIDKHAVGYYDTSLKAWIAEEGRFEVLIGASSADIKLVFTLLSCDVCFRGNDTPADTVSSAGEQYRSRSRSPSPGSSRASGQTCMYCHNWLAVYSSIYSFTTLLDGRMQGNNGIFDACAGGFGNAAITLRPRDLGPSIQGPFALGCLIFILVHFLRFNSPHCTYIHSS